MPPKQVTLANAGRKLTGPPEGYGRKKELQIKHWLTLALPTEDAAAAAAESDALEPLRSPTEMDDHVHQLYGQLRDSTDGFLQQQASTPKCADARPLSPFPEQPQSPPTPQSHPAHTARPASSSPVPTAHSSSPMPAAPAGPLRAMSIGNNPTFDMDSDPDPDHEASLGPLVAAPTHPPKPSPLNPSHPSARASLVVPSAAAASPLTASRTATPLSQSMSAAAQPLEFVLDANLEWPQAVAIEAGLLLARMEVSKPAGASEVAVLKLALQAAVAEKQQQQRAAQMDLAAAHEGAAAVQQREQRHAAALKEHIHRAQAAEAKLAVLQRELQQKQHREVSQAESQRRDLLSQVAQLQEALAAATEQQQQQAAAHQGEVQQLNNRLAELQKAAAAATHELVRLRTDSSVERSRLSAEATELRQAHSQLGGRLASALEQLAAAEARSQVEVAARKAAEAAERREMAALQEHAAVAAELAAVKQSNAALKRRTQSAMARTAAAVLADPVDALLPAARPRPPSSRRLSLPQRLPSTAVRSGSPPTAERQPGRTVARSAEIRSKPLRRSAASLSPEPRPASASAAAAPQSPSPPPAHMRLRKPPPAQRARPPSAPAAAPAQGLPEKQQQHPGPLRAMQQAVASERRALADAQRLQRRVQAQAELEESRQVQDALAAAPECLRAANLAFRAYVVAGCVAPGSLAAQLAAALAKEYRVYVDPLPLHAEGAAEDSAADAQQVGALVGLAAAVVCVLEKGCLDSPARMAEMHQACVRNSRLLLVCTAGVAALTDAMPAPGSTASSGDAAAAAAAHAAVADYVAAAWEHRVKVPSSSAEDVAAAAGAVAGLLGVPDADLALLPLAALKRLGRMQQPDFIHLDCQGLTSLALAALRAGAGSAPHPHAMLRALAGNTTLQSISVSSSPAFAEALAAGLLANPASAMLSVTFGTVPIPVAPLLGRGQPPLQLLDLSKGPLVAEDAAALAVLLPRAPALARVLLGGGHGSPPSAVSAQLALALGAVATLQSVNEVALAPLLTCAGGVLDLSETGLGPVGAGVVLHLLQSAPHAASLKSIRGINLTGCSIGAAAAGALCSLLSAIPPLQLRALCLGDNQLGPQGAATLGALLGGDAAPSALGLLEVSVNNLGDEGCATLARSLGRLTGLERLALASNTIGPEGIRPLCSALPALPRLVDLQLNGNVVGDSGAAALAAALPGLTNLQSLSLAENYNIGQEGARALASWLADAPALTSLLLAKNSLGAEGAKQLAAGLRANSSLRVLDLEWCKLRAEGLEHIAGALEHNTTLRELLLSRNAAGDRGVKALVEVMGAGGGQGLVALDLRGNNIGITGCRLLNGLLQDRGCCLVELRMEKNIADEQVLRALEELAAAERGGPSRSISRGASFRSAAASGAGPQAQVRPLRKLSPGQATASVRSSTASSLDPSSTSGIARHAPQTSQNSRRAVSSKVAKPPSVAASLPAPTSPLRAAAGRDRSSAPAAAAVAAAPQAGLRDSTTLRSSRHHGAAPRASKAGAAELLAGSRRPVTGSAPGQLTAVAAAPAPRASSEQVDLEELLSRYRTGNSSSSNVGGGGMGGGAA